MKTLTENCQSCISPKTSASESSALTIVSNHALLLPLHSCGIVARFFCHLHLTTFANSSLALIMYTRVLETHHGAFIYALHRSWHHGRSQTATPSRERDRALPGRNDAVRQRPEVTSCPQPGTGKFLLLHEGKELAQVQTRLACW